MRFLGMPRRQQRLRFVASTDDASNPTGAKVANDCGGHLDQRVGRERGGNAPEAAEGAPGALDEALDEGEGSVGDLAPAAVDGEGVAAVGNLSDLGDALVARLLLVRGVRDRPRDGVVLLAGDDQERSAVGVLAVDLRLGPRVQTWVITAWASLTAAKVRSAAEVPTSI